MTTLGEMTLEEAAHVGVRTPHSTVHASYGHMKVNWPMNR